MLFIIVISSTLVSAVRINEVELNPAGTDSGNEWIELYSSSEINLDGWSIVNVKGKNMSLDESFSGYKIIITPYNFLANDKQKLVLFDNSGNKIDETAEISDNYNDERTWQFCDKWVFIENTKEEKNACKESVSEEKIKEETKETEAVQEINKEPDIQEDRKITSEAVSENEPKEEVIQLNIGQKDIKTWKSKKEYIKEYSLAGFALFCVGILIFLLIKNGRQNSVSDDF